MRFTQSAHDDLLEAWRFVAEENAAAADRMLDVIAHEALTLLRQPLMGRARPELGEGVPSWPTATSYILFYVTDDQGVVVVRVLHHARDFSTIDFRQ